MAIAYKPVNVHRDSQSKINYSHVFFIEKGLKVTCSPNAIMTYELDLHLFTYRPSLMLLVTSQLNFIDLSKEKVYYVKLLT